MRPLSHGNHHPRIYDIHVVLPRRSLADLAAVFTCAVFAGVTALKFSQFSPAEPLLRKCVCEGYPMRDDFLAGRGWLPHPSSMSLQTLNNRAPMLSMINLEISTNIADYI